MGNRHNHHFDRRRIQVDPADEGFAFAVDDEVLGAEEVLGELLLALEGPQEAPFRGVAGQRLVAVAHVADLGEAQVALRPVAPLLEDPLLARQEPYPVAEDLSAVVLVDVQEQLVHEVRVRASLGLLEEGGKGGDAGGVLLLRFLLLLFTAETVLLLGTPFVRG